MKKRGFLLFILLIMISTLLVGQTLPDKAIVGYWHNWGYTPNSLLLTDIPDAYDVINIAFATPTEPFGSTMQFTPDSGIYPNPDDFIADISYLQELGKKVVISIGGANDPVMLLNPGDVQNFVTSMSTIITTYGFNGIDIDLEGGSISLATGDNDFRYPTTPKIINLIDAITQLTDTFLDLMLSTAPETAYVQGGYSTYAGIWGAYLPLIHALRERWTYVHVQHYNTGCMYGRDGILYDPPTADFHVAMADMLLAGFYVDVWVGNIFFDPLEPEQVAIGLPASTSAAGSGYTEPDVVHTALDYIILGTSFGGQYQLSNPDGYEDFRGLMTWSINWDVANNCEFSNAHRPYLDDLMGVSVFENNIPEENNILVSNYPNPFNPDTNIAYSIKEACKITLEVYNIKGQLVKTLIDEVKEAGDYSISWNGKDNTGKITASGVYVYKMNAGKYSSTKKMILMK